ncbi:ras-like protein rasD [Drosophila miranda]|uniref:ras-like protein rasD n=1 Tax=Drosophila miranda TaxID=7229 RepID=UPI0007E6860D|nr:ras-like protein rasD [Drosophila miranda]
MHLHHWCICNCNCTCIYIQQIAENFDMPFFEVSCKSNINIEDAFLSLARKIREQRERRGDNLDNEENKDKKSPGSNGLGTFTFTLSAR